MAPMEGEDEIAHEDLVELTNVRMVHRGGRRAGLPAEAAHRGLVGELLRDHLIPLPVPGHRGANAGGDLIPAVATRAVIEPERVPSTRVKSTQNTSWGKNASQKNLRHKPI